MRICLCNDIKDTVLMSVNTSVGLYACMYERYVQIDILYTIMRTNRKIEVCKVQVHVCFYTSDISSLKYEKYSCSEFNFLFVPDLTFFKKQDTVA